MIHTMRKKQGRKGLMAIKVDLEKAYDRISWKFMAKVLKEIKCPDEMIERLIQCIKSPTTSILWNGEKMEAFSTSRGLRQGDPISPYLFVLGMEKLTHLILDRVREKKWKGVRAGRRGPTISHMMFADDLVLFAEATTDQINVILNCLQEFEEMSGHKISQEKTYIYFSKNVKSQDRREICNTSNFKEVQDLGRYLGANLTFPKKRKDKYRSIVERVKKRLNGWKASSLSLAGRLTLVKSVTSSMAMFTMQHDRIPKGVVEEIERTQRNFIWGDKEGSKKRHAIAWNQMCKLKDEGGAGLKTAKEMNDAFLTKVLWKVYTEPEQLWVKVLKGKYGRAEETSAKFVAKNGDSKFWKEVVKMEDGLWQNMVISEGREGENAVWKLTPSGQYTVSSMYNWLIRANPVLGKKKWKRVWKLQVPERIRVFMWMTLHKRLTTKRVTGRWDGSNGVCPLCQQEQEDQLHALRDCRHAKRVWYKLVPNGQLSRFFFVNWNTWIRNNLLRRENSFEEAQWPELFSIACWYIWNWRNGQVHDQGWEEPYKPEEKVRNFHRYYKQKWKGDELEPPRETLMMVGWKYPKAGWCKINIDGKWSSTQGAGCGGVIRGDEGEWLGGFVKQLDVTEPLITEVFAALEGLKLCWEMGFRKVEMESDAVIVVEALENNSMLRGCEQLLSQIHEFLQRDWEITVAHVYREANRCAHEMAKLSYGTGRQIWTSPPLNLIDFLQEDIEGKCFPRRVIM